MKSNIANKIVGFVLLLSVVSAFLYTMIRAYGFVDFMIVMAILVFVAFLVYTGLELIYSEEDK